MLVLLLGHTFWCLLAIYLFLGNGCNYAVVFTAQHKWSAWVCVACELAICCVLWAFVRQMQKRLFCVLFLFLFWIEEKKILLEMWVFSYDTPSCLYWTKYCTARRILLLQGNNLVSPLRLGPSSCWYLRRVDYIWHLCLFICVAPRLKASSPFKATATRRTVPRLQQRVLANLMIKKSSRSFSSRLKVRGELSATAESSIYFLW